MTAADLIAELSKYPAYLPVKCMDEPGNCGDTDRVKFEGNHLRVVIEDVEFAAPPDEYYGDGSDMLDEIESKITSANWRTGTKKELRQLIEDIDAELSKRVDA